MGNPGPRGPKKSHVVRCYDDVWQKALVRAEAEGVTRAHVIDEFLEAYANGAMDFGKKQGGEEDGREVADTRS